MLWRLWWFTMWNTNWYVTKEHARSVVVVFLFFWCSFALTRYVKWRNNHPQPTSISSEWSSSKERASASAHERERRKKKEREKTRKLRDIFHRRHACAPTSIVVALGQTSITYFLCKIAVNLIGEKDMSPDNVKRKKTTSGWMTDSRDR